MEYTVINGLEDKKEYAAASEKIKAAVNETGLVINWIDLKSLNIKHCIGCDYCREVNPGVCALKDDRREILKAFISADKVLMITSVHYGSCNCITKNFMDRSEPLYLPYQIAKGTGSMMKGRYEKYPSFAVIGINEESKDNEMCFIDFIRNSNLSQVCPKTSVKVFSKEEPKTEDISRFIKEKFIYE